MKRKINSHRTKTNPVEADHIRTTQMNQKKRSRGNDSADIHNRRSFDVRFFVPDIQQFYCEVFKILQLLEIGIKIWTEEFSQFFCKHFIRHVLEESPYSTQPLPVL